MGYVIEIIGLYEQREEWESERIFEKKIIGQVKTTLETAYNSCRREGMWEAHDMVREKQEQCRSEGIFSNSWPHPLPF